MPTAPEGYYIGTERIPSVTTITGRFKDSSGLMIWAFEEGKRAINEGAPGRRLYDEKRAADIGTLAHAMVEAQVRGQEPPAQPAEMVDEDFAKALSAFGSYETWARHTRLKLRATEVRLISQAHRVGGTMDAIGEIDRELCLLDYKTSNRIYGDFLIQVAAYGKLWEENFPDRPLSGGYHLLRFSKESGDFSHHYYPNLDDAWEAFLLERRLYDIAKKLEKRAA